MRYLGSVSGSGVLDPETDDAAKAEFEFECYVVKADVVTGSGEIIAATDVLKRLFGRNETPFTTEAGHKLKLRLSDSKAAPSGDSAHVVVSGDLPVVKGRSLFWGAPAQAAPPA